MAACVRSTSVNAYEFVDEKLTMVKKNGTLL